MEQLSYEYIGPFKKQDFEGINNIFVYAIFPTSTFETKARRHFKIGANN